MIRPAASISARWEKACGKLPRCRPVLVSNSSAYRPSGEADPQQSFHQVARPLLLADDRQRRHQPERADQEAALLAAQPVVGLVGAVAQDEAVLRQFIGDRHHGRVQALVVVGQEPEDRRQQRRSVERVGFVVLAQHPLLADAVGEDVLVDLLRRRPPFGLQLGVPAHRRQLRGAVHRHPAHDLRGDVVPRLAPRLPDPLVRLRPHALRRSWPAPRPSATAAAAAAGCGGCAAGSSPGRRRRRRSGAGRRRRCRSAPDVLRRSRSARRGSTPSGRAGRRSRT